MALLWDREVQNAVAHWGPAYGVKIPAAVVHAILEKETVHGRDPHYLKTGGAIREPDGDYSYGPMMVKGDTARSELGISDPATLRFPAAGINAGVHYLAILLARFKGNLARAVTAYNGSGPAARVYAGKVLTVAKQYAGVVVPVAAILALVALLFLMPRHRASASR
jgi:hypothetical protein